MSIWKSVCSACSKGLETAKETLKTVKSLGGAIVSSGHACIAGVKVIANVVKAFLYDLPKALKEGLYDRDTTAAVTSMEEAGADLYSAGERLVEGLTAGVEVVDSSLKCVGHAVTGGYHALGTAYYTAAAAVETAQAIGEGAYAAAQGVASGINAVRANIPVLPSFSTQRSAMASLKAKSGNGEDGIEMGLIRPSLMMSAAAA